MFDRTGTTQPSRPASVFSAQSIDTVVADTSYRGYPSEQAYLDALRAWASSKMYQENDDQLPGFYGHNTVDDILLKQGCVRGVKKTKTKRRATLAPQLDTVVEGNGCASVSSMHSSINVAGATKAANPSTERRGSAFKRVFSRRKTVA